VTDRRQYPWNGHIVRNKDEKYKGQMMANFKRGRGDNMGTAGFLNDNADIPAPVHSYWPNDFGLYNMAGNVNEWVMDVFVRFSEDKSDFNPTVVMCSRHNSVMKKVRFLKKTTWSCTN
jgi:formylglycine-generating enzyme required for sulfatase activity